MLVEALTSLIISVHQTSNDVWARMTRFNESPRVESAAVFPVLSVWFKGAWERGYIATSPLIEETASTRLFSILEYNFFPIYFSVNLIAMFVSEMRETRCRYAGDMSDISGHEGTHSKLPPINWKLLIDFSWKLSRNCHFYDRSSLWLLRNVALVAFGVSTFKKLFFARLVARKALHLAFYDHMTSSEHFIGSCHMAQERNLQDWSCIMKLSCKNFTEFDSKINKFINFVCFTAQFKYMTITYSILYISKIQLVVYHQCCVLIGWATSRLFVIAH